MKHILLIGFFISLLTGQAIAQPAADTILMVKLEKVEVTGNRKWENDTVRYRYNQTKYYVKTILPYLKEATKLFNDINSKRNDPSISKRDRKAYINAQEQLVRDKFERDIKNLNETQGMLLMKLTARQTGVNIYEMLQEFKNPLTAIKWQAYARLNGFNINRKYNPDNEPMLEHIMESLDYPLPVDIYGNGERTASAAQ